MKNLINSLKLFCFFLTFVLQIGCYKNTFPDDYSYGDIRLSVEHTLNAKLTVTVSNIGKTPVFIPEINEKHLINYGFHGGYHLYIKSSDDNIIHIQNINRPPSLDKDDFVYLKPGEYRKYVVDLSNMRVASKTGENDWMIRNFSDQSASYDLKLVLVIDPSFSFLPRSEEILKNIFIGESEVDIVFEFTAESPNSSEPQTSN